MGQRHPQRLTQGGGHPGVTGSPDIARGITPSWSARLEQARSLSASTRRVDADGVVARRERSPDEGDIEP